MRKNDRSIKLGLCPKKVFHIQVTTVVEFGKKAGADQLVPACTVKNRSAVVCISQCDH